MYITVNQLAAAINNLERINITDVYQEQKHIFEIDFINSAGHIVFYRYIDCNTREQAINTVSEQEKRLYSDCTIKVYQIK